MNTPKSTSTTTFFFDFIDPISFLMEREIRSLEGDLGVAVRRVGIELNPPPHPVGTPDDGVWSPRWSDAEGVAASRGIALVRPALVPWSRKAHELMEHADERAPEVVPTLRASIFDAFFTHGRDIGRVDVLVALARDVGLDLTETKAVLDVDRHEEEVARRRQVALEAGLGAIPTLAAGSRSLEGFHNRASLSTFLDGSHGPSST